MTAGDGTRSPAPFVLVTGNLDKLAEAERILGRRLERIDLELPEIQSDDLLEVLEAKGEAAWGRLRRPLVVEETGLELSACRGFPGPLVKWMLKAMGAEGIARLALAAGDGGAVARCALFYRDTERTIVGEGSTRGRLVAPPRGASGFGWDPVFVPLDESATCAELGEEVKDRIGPRGRAWRDLLVKLG